MRYDKRFIPKGMVETKNEYTAQCTECKSRTVGQREACGNKYFLRCNKCNALFQIPKMN